MLVTRVRSIRRWLPLSAALPALRLSAISALALAGAIITVACGSSGSGDSGSGDDCDLRECKLISSDIDIGDSFGSSVAVSGDLIVVAAWLDDAPEDDSGSAYVFRFDGTDWVEEQKLTASDAAAKDFFGKSVGTSGDTIVVGATGNGGSGAAYVYRFDGADWVKEEKLTASDGAEVNSFGRSVSISGDVIVIGAGGPPGAAYVFRFDGTEWTEEQKLTASDGAEVALFGRSIAVSGDTIVVGAFKDGVLGLELGAAYVYRFDGTNWIEEDKLTASDAGRRDHFGSSVAYSGDVIVVGAPGNGSSGSAYVFGFDGTEWVQEEKFTASDGAAGDGFGGAVAAIGEMIVVGASGNSGSVYVFRSDGTEWVEERKLTASDAAAGDRFGGSVAVSGEVIVIGAPRNNDPGSDSGSAYVFRE